MIANEKGATMTTTPPAPQEPRHCDHECVCETFENYKDWPDDVFPCPEKGCKHDTRSCPAIPKDATPLENVLKVVIQEKEKQLAVFRSCWDNKTIDLIKDWGESLRKIEAILLQQEHPMTPTTNWKKGEK